MTHLIKTKCFPLHFHICLCEMNSNEEDELDIKLLLCGQIFVYGRQIDDKLERCPIDSAWLFVIKTLKSSWKKVSTEFEYNNNRFLSSLAYMHCTPHPPLYKVVYFLRSKCGTHRCNIIAFQKYSMDFPV